MKNVLLIGGLTLVVAIGCQTASKESSWPGGDHGQAVVTLHVPTGDAIAGREAFFELRCHACHRVEGEQFPEPVATPEVPVVLGKTQACQPSVRLLESIMDPSCRIPPNLPNVRSGTLSRMGDYGSAMTVEQLIDLVAFIRSLDDPARQAA